MLEPDPGVQEAHGEPDDRRQAEPDAEAPPAPHRAHHTERVLTGTRALLLMARPWRAMERGHAVVYPAVMDEAELDVTVVLPVFNEKGHLRTEIDRIRAALEASPYSFEIIVVDDGSND